MYIHFQLRPVEEIAPWGYKEHPTLHWFGLTDGWYWIDVGDTQLFRYSDPEVAYILEHYPETRSNPMLSYADYYVVRLWEDILEILPDVLTPLPPELACRLENVVGWRQWCMRAEHWVDSAYDHVRDEFNDIRTTALEWWWHRHLYNGPLGGLNISIWNDGKLIHCAWDNRCNKPSGIPLWEAQLGEVSLPVETFIEEVNSFHERLMAEMQERVQAALTNWSRPEVSIDLEHLANEQPERAGRLAKCLEKVQAKATSSWDTVLQAMQTIEESLAFQFPMYDAVAQVSPSFKRDKIKAMPVWNEEEEGFEDAEGNVWRWHTAWSSEPQLDWLVEHLDGTHTNVGLDGKITQGLDYFSENRQDATLLDTSSDYIPASTSRSFNASSGSQQIIDLLERPVLNRRPIVRKLVAEVPLSEIVTALEYSLDHTDQVSSRTRQLLCDILARYGDKDALPALLKVLHDEARNVRNSALEAVGYILKSSVAESLVERFALEDDELQRTIMVCFARMDYRPAVPLLLPELTSPSEMRRRCAAWALGDLCDSVAKEPLRLALERESEPFTAMIMKRALDAIVV